LFSFIKANKNTEIKTNDGVYEVQNRNE